MSEQPIVRAESLRKSFRGPSRGIGRGHAQVHAVDGVTLDVGQGETLGLEADLRWIVNDAWDLYATVGLLNAEFDEFVTPQVDLTGRQQAHAPETSLAIGG